MEKDNLKIIRTNNGEMIITELVKEDYSHLILKNAYIIMINPDGSAGYEYLSAFLEDNIVKINADNVFLMENPNNEAKSLYKRLTHLRNMEDGEDISEEDSMEMAILDSKNSIIH